MLQYSNMEEFINSLESTKTVQDARLCNVIVLAFVGDSLYCSYVRVYLANNHLEKAHKLHLYANAYVKASSQAYAFNVLKESGYFTEAELNVAGRARNAKLAHIAKNASLEDYKLATAFESVCGYMFFANEKQRLIETIKKAVEIIKENLKETNNANRRKK